MRRSDARLVQLWCPSGVRGDVGAVKARDAGAAAGNSNVATEPVSACNEDHTQT